MCGIWLAEELLDPEGLLEGVIFCYAGMPGVSWTPSAVRMTCYNTTKGVYCESVAQMHVNRRQVYNVRDAACKKLCNRSGIRKSIFVLPCSASPTRCAISSFPVAYLQQRLVNIQACCDMTPCRLANSFRRFERYGVLNLQIRAVQKQVDCLILKMKPLRYFKKSESSHLTVRRHKHVTLQQQRWENLKAPKLLEQCGGPTSRICSFDSLH